MGSSGQIEAEIWQFEYLGYDWHTKQCRRSKMQPKWSIQQPFTTHKNTRTDHTDEEWWRDGAKRTNRSRDMAVCVFGVALTHKTVQKNQNSSKKSHPSATYNHTNTCKDHTDEGWWRDGVKQKNKNQDMAIWVFWVQLMHKTVQMYWLWHCRKIVSKTKLL